MLRLPSDRYYAFPDKLTYNPTVRSLYAHDQREWVKYCDVTIPEALTNAIKFQENGRKLYQAAQELSGPVKALTLEMASDSYDEARRYLQRLLHYQAVRRVNLPQD